MRLNFTSECPANGQAFTAKLLRKLPHRLGAQERKPNALRPTSGKPPGSHSVPGLISILLYVFLGRSLNGCALKDSNVNICWCCTRCEGKEVLQESESERNNDDLKAKETKETKELFEVPQLMLRFLCFGVLKLKEKGNQFIQFSSQPGPKRSKRVDG